MDTLEQIESKLRGRVTAVHVAARNLDEGDQWQDGAMFIPFAFMSSQEKAESQVRLKDAFVSENVVTKVIDNEQNGLLGREADFSIVLEEGLSDSEVERLTEVKSKLEKVLVRYWNETEAIKLLRENFRLAATQERAIERGFIPPGYIENRNIKRQADLLSAMKMLEFQVLSADKAGVFKDATFYKNYGVFIKESDGVKKIEICSVDTEGKTRLRVIRQTTGQGDVKATLPTLANYIPVDKSSVQDANPQDLGGQLLMFEVYRKPLITESIISNQKDVNLGHSMKVRGTYQNGHRDAFALNSQRPTEETTITNEDGSTTVIETPTEIVLGGGSTNFLNGAPVYKKKDNGEVELVGYANASVQVVEPINPENFIKSIESGEAAIYRQCCQEHLYANQNVSGKSKEVSRAPFEKKLVNLKPVFDAYGRWKLTLLMYFGVVNSETDIKLDDLKHFRIDFNCIVDAGAPDAEIIAAAQKDVNEGRLSPETYISKYQGSEDADAEMARLKLSEVFQLSQIKLRLEAAILAKEADLPPKYIVNLLSIEDETEKQEILEFLEGAKEDEKQNELFRKVETTGNGNGSK